ncbi:MULTISPECIES: YbhB/YbcL family Raf kinase inhibitor-like protein [Janthinobacterium]|uniref:YbhB/YbcL family Raf kinase inhibitor-like protein n=1 Tax=Janthinobacterium TaxID=29580 RepID=UPI00056142D8|nr:MULTISPECIES: YbhB/YbcL family Raf kinase inhibitor-like protein [unclassified Janthinobacterium]NVI82887.1 YbhB/YbcL family Raf kinase inhibitor-like protein [Janthinobacterium sp. BJB401]
MKLWSETFRDGGLMPADYAFAEIDPASRVRLAGNRNPHLAWDEVPNGTESLALFCIDPDAPQDASLANVEGQALSLTALRGDFYHWSLLDIPLAMRAIAAGEFSSGITPRGKAASSGLRQGLNDYTGWFAGDAAMAGDYYGYDGPCPPWNDERIHHYIFRLYALDVPQLALPERFTGQQAHAALYGHILDEAQLVVAYSLNPELAITLKK